MLIWRGMLRWSEHRDRYFWMSTNGKFAGGNFRFDVIDRSGVYPLNDSYAVACGFTYSFNLPGDLIFRASFLACHVESVNDVSYALQYRFVRLDSLGRETVYPFSLSCSTESPWNPREIVCEENYMEVSVRKNVPVIAQEGLEKEDWEAALSIVSELSTGIGGAGLPSFPNGSGFQLAFHCCSAGPGSGDVRVVFHQTGMTPKTMTAEDARTAGYLVNSTSSRVILRSPYGMPMSEVLLRRWMLLLVDTSAACAKNPSVFDGTYLSWVTPRLITPLVLHPTKFLDKRFTMGVEGRALDEVTAISREYQLLVNRTAVEICIPFGAVGGYRKLAFHCCSAGPGSGDVRVVFHQTGMTPKTMTAEDARTAGYLVNSTSSRVILRSPYGMPMSEVLLVSGIPVEVVRATVFYKQRWMLLLVDTSAACAKNPSVFDGTYLSWVTPRLITPLVLHPTKFLDKRFTMGVEGRALDEVTAISREYQLLVNRTAVEICIPFGAVGGYRKYNQVYEIDLFLEHQWADDLWEVTQHRSFKPARSPYLPETPYVVNNTVLSEKDFTVTLGNFKPDVELKNLTLNGVPLTLPEAQNRGVKISEVLHPNDTKDFVLKVPFDNPLVSVEYIGALIRRYTLNINYTLNIVPQNEPYFHPAAIVCDVKDVNLPDVKSFCTNRSVVFKVTPGNMDSSWELCIGSRPLPYTIAEPKITIELPLFSIGYIYEDISLRGLTVRVELNMRNIKTLQVEKQFVQRCPIPTRELLVCFPNGVVTVVAVTMEPIPVVDPSKTTLLDKTCKPKEFDSTRALFTFGVNTCGTRSQIVGNYLIYENEVLYTRALFPPSAPVITRDSEYRLTIRCRYPLNDTLTLAAERKAVPAPAPYSVKGLGSLYFWSYDPMSRDVSYSQFYSAFPVSQSLLEPVFLQVELLQPHSQTDRLILQDCWATLTPELDSSPQWDLVTDRCLVTGDSYRTHFHPVLASTLPRSSPQLQRLEVRAQQSSKDSAFWRQLPGHWRLIQDPLPPSAQRLEVRAQQSSKDSAFWRQVYFHCMAVVCDPNLKDTCNKTCVPGAQRSGEHLQPRDLVVMAALIITGVVIRDKRFLRWVGETLEFRWLLNKDPEVSNLNI
ncbi:UNVERIFIED_CONTAM: hypothetical protein FKN15_072916 [Acipenser sinensis]